MTLEENVLSYLDGSLGADESAELLHTLSASPDKRRLLEEHLRMKDILALGKRPFTVSPEVERSLAARIPALRPIVQGTRPFAFATKSFTRIFATAATVAFLTAGGLLTWYSASPDAATPPINTKSIAGAIGAMPNPSMGLDQQSSGDLSNRSGSSTPNANTGNNVSSNSGVHGVSQSTSWPIGDQILRSHSMQNVPSNIEQVSRGTTHASSSSPVDAPELTSGSSTAGGDEQIASVGMREQDIQIPGARIAHTLSEITMPEPASTGSLGIGLHFSELQYTLPRLSSDALSQTFMATNPSMVLNYYLTENFTLDMEVGASQYAVASENMTQPPSTATSALQNYSRVIRATNIDQAMTTWARLGVDYTFNPESELPFTVGASGGLAFESTTQPIAALSAGVSRVLSNSLVFDLALVATGTWGSPGSGALNPQTSDVTGFVYSSANPQRTFMSAVGLRAGVRYRP